jgi:hypothetical protein
VYDHSRPITTDLACSSCFDDDNPEAYSSSHIIGNGNNNSRNSKTVRDSCTQILDNLNIDSNDNGSAPVNF